MNEAPEIKKLTKQMRDMGSPSGEFWGIAPAQVRQFLDVARGEDLRVWAALQERVAALTPDGKKQAYAREPATGVITRPGHLKEYLGMFKSQVSESLGRLKAAKVIDMHDGKIWPRADVPEPNMMGKKPKKGEDGAKPVHCTVNLNYLEANFLNKLEAVDPERFQAAAVAVVVSEEWGGKVKADAIAWARDRAAEARRQVFTELGYTNEEGRGAPKKRNRTNSEEHRPEQSFAQFTVQRTVEIQEAGTRFTVQGQTLVVFSEPKESRTNEQPYKSDPQTSESQPASNEGANAARATSQAELKQAAAIAAVKIEVNALIQQKRLRIGMGAAAVSAGTVTNLATILAALPTAGAVLEVIDTLAKRITEYQTGNPRDVENIGAYLVGVAKAEVAERLEINVKAAAAGMAMPGKAKSAKAGQS